MHDAHLDEVRVLWGSDSDNLDGMQRADTSPSSTSSSSSREDPMLPALTLAPTHNNNGQQHHNNGSSSSTSSPNNVPLSTKRMINRNISYLWRDCGATCDEPLHRRQHSPRSSRVKSNSSAAPPPRFGHTAVVYNGKMIAFGGRNGGEFYSDVWSYDCTSRTWEGGPWACQGDLTIAPRCGHTATLINDRWMVVIGGCVGVDARACVGDVWSLDLATKSWQCHSHNQRRTPLSLFHDPMAAQVNNAIYYATAHNHNHNFMTFAVPQPPRRTPNNNRIPSKKGHTTVNVDNTTLLVFGGTSGVPALDDAAVWCLDIPSTTWAALSTTGNRPEARMYHVAELTERRTMIVFGGKLSNQRFSNDLYELVLPDILPTGGGGSSSPSTPSARYHQQQQHGVWRKIDIHSSIQPSARFCCTSVYVNGTLCVFLGGSDCYHNDSFEFNFTTHEWKALPQSSEGVGLPPCTRPTTVHDGNTITFFGGCTARNECMNTVMQLGLETPSLKELCREWVKNRTNLVASRPGTALQSPTGRHHRANTTTGTTPSVMSRQHSTSAFYGAHPPSDDAVDAGQLLPEALMEYLIGYD
ncbi:Hypothetical protein, putative [Bodo saltans]|uniref:Galactose oxidase n=1 Tax=Bodo saltans TaxID=75058 RepID=A0A0S4KG66_BODSA|nr:Hypothetical protein, putative [Bodo saltans]|eukprot:CUI14666.1 Hypothetical protein, putative [Bodo saltans]